MSRLKPPFRADQVGSLLRPERLATARHQALEGKISGEALKAIQDECIADAVEKQEALGLKAVTDGEFRRDAWQWDFLCGLEGVEQREEDWGVAFQSGHAPRSVYTFGKISNPGGVFVEGFKYLKSLASVTSKLTIPSPAMMYHRAGRRAIDADVYPGNNAFFEDIAVAYAEEVHLLGDAGCTYLQFDDTSYAMMCDQNVRQNIKERGDDPDDLIEVYGATIGKATKDRPSDMAVTVHMCRGNHMSNWIAEGGYEPVAEKMFNAVDVDGYFMEWDTDRAGGFEPLRFVPDGKVVVLGLITSKFPELEDKDDIKRRIDEAAQYVPLENLCLSPQCGFASTHHGNKLTEDEQFKKLALIVEIAEDVWGSV